MSRYLAAECDSCHSVIPLGEAHSQNWHIVSNDGETLDYCAPCFEAGEHLA